MPRVTVIIPTHNRAAMLSGAVESARRAGEDIEIIVVDDASTDATEMVCRDLVGVSYVRMDRNVGPSGARNEGIKRSTGEFIAFLDDDDLRIAGSIDAQSEILRHDEGISFVYGPVRMADSQLLPTGEIRPEHCPSGDIFWRLMTRNLVYTPAVLLRKRYVEITGMFEPGLRQMEDWDLWLRLAGISTVGAVPEPVAIVRGAAVGSAQLSADRPRMCRRAARVQARALRLPRALAADPGKRRKMRSEFISDLWDQLIREGDGALSRGDIRYAAMNYITAVQICPRRAVRVGAVASVTRSIFSTFRQSR